MPVRLGEGRDLSENENSIENDLGFHILMAMNIPLFCLILASIADG